MYMSPVDSDGNDVTFFRNKSLHQVWEYLDKIYVLKSPDPRVSECESSNDEQLESDK